ncbi:MAG: preprotein translocase subunit SecY [Crocinitomicaceae bacterium]|nr:preprotein translocase subunit SecY [Crocinitomicaceae bacterium]|tara:strand:+ start:2841 stop:4169 length:1329 start_codon:yes stop_codon:yes gene_type:complete
MKGLIATLKQIWAVEELRKRILYTLLLILVYRIGSFIVLPGINAEALNSTSSQGGILSLINMFAGGAFSRASIMALGIMPYISASIVMQLLGMAVPTFQRLQREGESGRKKINQYTRILTIGICLFQAPSYMVAYVPQEAIISNTTMWWIQAVAVLTAGTMFVTWLGERITDRGIGNGISLIITIGIIAGLPGAFLQEVGTKITDGGFVLLLVELVLFLLVIVLTILLVQGTRRIPVHTAKRVIGRGSKQAMAGGQRSYIPLKINQAGVMPIIFAQALMFVPALVFTDTFLETTFSDVQGFWYNLVFFLMIVIFTYFYTAIMMNPVQMADELKRNGSFIPGVKPGKKTSDFIEGLISRLVFPGSIFLGIIAIMPAFAMIGGIDQGFAYFFGGTSLLIMVGVVLDTLQQIESHLLNRHYDGLIKGGRIKGRSSSSAVTMSQAL